MCDQVEMRLPLTIQNTCSEIINVFKEGQQRGKSVLSFEKNCKTPKLESHVILTKRVSENTHKFGASGDNLTGKDDEETLRVSHKDSTVQRWSISTPMSSEGRST